jgi:hypothetical protein
MLVIFFYECYDANHVVGFLYLSDFLYTVLIIVDNSDYIGDLF